MRQVTVHMLDPEGNPVQVGVIRLEGGRLVADPPGEPTLEAILGEPILAGGDDFVTSREAPEAFLTHLHETYDGAYLSVSEPEAVS